MALPDFRGDREVKKFVEDDAGDVTIRIKPVAGTVGSGSGLPTYRGDMEHTKFIEDDAGDVAILITA